jgi:very-short-patch-repair endonuclease
MVMQPKPTDRVLVAIMNNHLDFGLAHDKHWYRIPVSSAAKWLKGRWPPHWLAFYQTKVFGAEACGIHYYAKVEDVVEASRGELLPDETGDPKRGRRYYKLLRPLRCVDRPIVSRRRRRIVFIPTTGAKFLQATEINDLYDESPLEDLLWAAFKLHDIPAERQEFVRIEDQDYALDFAIRCAKGKLRVEADGDTWHANPARAAVDRPRDNALEVTHWHVLHFGTREIREQMADYCIPTVVKEVNNLGGVEEDGLVPRKINPRLPPGMQQLTLLDGR